MALPQIRGTVLPGAKVTAQSTKASAENLNLLPSGRGEIALTPGNAWCDAWKGDAEAGLATPLKKLHSVAGVDDNGSQIVAGADAGIQSMADLKVKQPPASFPRR